MTAKPGSPGFDHLDYALNNPLSVWQLGALGDDLFIGAFHLSFLQMSFIPTLLDQFFFVQLLLGSHLFHLGTHRILGHVKQQISL